MLEMLTDFLINLPFTYKRIKFVSQKNPIVFMVFECWCGGGGEIQKV